MGLSAASQTWAVSFSARSNARRWRKRGRKPHQHESMNKYDLIGDIHGYAAELKRLLAQLGYEMRDGCYRARADPISPALITASPRAES